SRRRPRRPLQAPGGVNRLLHCVNRGGLGGDKLSSGAHALWPASNCMLPAMFPAKRGSLYPEEPNTTPSLRSLSMNEPKMSASIRRHAVGASLFMTALLLLTGAAGAQTTKDFAQGNMRFNARAMDTDHDGTITKEEFMKYAERKFDKMKGADGMVSVA